MGGAVVSTSSTNGAPFYANTSTLKYNTGGTYNRGLEWSANSGAGWPGNVQVSGNTTLNMGNAARSMAGNLTIDTGSTLSMGSIDGANLTLAGNWTNHGTFTPNVRTVIFNGSTP